MKRILTIILLLLMLAPGMAQKKSATVKKSPVVTKTAQKKQTSSKSAKKQQAPTISGLKKERENIQKKIKQQEQALKANKADVENRLKQLLVLNGEIKERQRNIDGIQHDINKIDGDINMLQIQLETLEKQLAEKKQNYVKSMRYVSRHRSVQDKLMFIFSAESLTKMYRRLRFIRQYASYQRAQGEQLKVKQQQVADKKAQLEGAKYEKSNLLQQGQRERNALQAKQGEHQAMVNTLQKQQKTIQGIIAQQRQKDAALNAQIDRMIAAEVARAKARAEAEAKRKAQAAAEAKRRAEELERKKAQAAAEAKENERRLEEARRIEREKKALAKSAENKSAAEREKANQAAHEATANREAIERKGQVQAERNKREIAAATKEASESQWMTSSDRKLSGAFESNKGRLPMPITGSYRIVSHFGQYNVEGLKNVTLDNKGINLQGQQGCQARSIFDGEVSAVFGFAGTNVVMIRHGAYISVYCNLRSVNVSRGQKVSARQVLGSVGQDNILQFQLRRETAKLNPEVWLGR